MIWEILRMAVDSLTVNKLRSFCRCWALLSGLVPYRHCLGGFRGPIPGDQPNIAISSNLITISPGIRREEAVDQFYRHRRLHDGIGRTDPAELPVGGPDYAELADLWPVNRREHQLPDAGGRGYSPINRFTISTRPGVSLSRKSMKPVPPM